MPVIRDRISGTEFDELIFAIALDRTLARTKMIENIFSNDRKNFSEELPRNFSRHRHGSIAAALKRLCLGARFLRVALRCAFRSPRQYRFYPDARIYALSTKR